MSRLTCALRQPLPRPAPSPPPIRACPVFGRSSMAWRPLGAAAAAGRAQATVAESLHLLSFPPGTSEVSAPAAAEALTGAGLAALLPSPASCAAGRCRVSHRAPVLTPLGRRAHHRCHPCCRRRWRSWWTACGRCSMWRQAPSVASQGRSPSLPFRPVAAPRRQPRRRRRPPTPTPSSSATPAPPAWSGSRRSFGCSWCSGDPAHRTAQARLLPWPQPAPAPLPACPLSLAALPPRCLAAPLPAPARPLCPRRCLPACTPSPAIDPPPLPVPPACCACCPCPDVLPSGGTVGHTAPPALPCPALPPAAMSTLNFLGCVPNELEAIFRRGGEWEAGLELVVALGVQVRGGWCVCRRDGGGGAGARWCVCVCVRVRLGSLGGRHTARAAGWGREACRWGAAARCRCRRAGAARAPLARPTSSLLPCHPHPLSRTSPALQEGSGDGDAEEFLSLAQQLALSSAFGAVQCSHGRCLSPPRHGAGGGGGQQQEGADGGAAAPAGAAPVLGAPDRMLLARFQQEQQLRDFLACPPIAALLEVGWGGGAGWRCQCDAGCGLNVGRGSCFGVFLPVPGFPGCRAWGIGLPACPPPHLPTCLHACPHTRLPPTFRASPSACWPAGQQAAAAACAVELRAGGRPQRQQHQQPGGGRPAVVGELVHPHRTTLDHACHAPNAGVLVGSLCARAWPGPGLPALPWRPTRSAIHF